MVQYAFVDILESDPEIKEVQCNVLLDDDPKTKEYMTDFLCTKNSGEKMVRECIYTRHLTKPLTLKLLDMSRNYWLNHGIEDWGIVIDEEE